MTDENTYIGTGEIRKEFGLERGQVLRLIRAGDFPEPVAHLVSGRVWTRGTVAAAIERLRHEGRVTADGRIIPRRFAVAEAGAQSVG